MTTGRGKWVGRSLALAALMMCAVAAAPASAQRQQQADSDCRCVDADGNQIADCTCFRTPQWETMAFPFGASRPRLGLSVSTSQGADLDAQGAEVNNVLPDGPASRAGIREGDVITRIGGQSLFESLPGDAEQGFDLDQSIPVQRLLAVARALDEGQEVEVTYLRDGQERTATVTAENLMGKFPPMAFDAEKLRGQLRGLQNLPDMPDFQSFEWRGGPGEPRVDVMGAGPGALLLSRARLYGLELVPLNEGLGQYFGTSVGVLVVNADEDSTLGLQAGDVILSVGGRDATTPDRVLRIIGSYGADEDIAIRVRRDGREIEVMGRLEG